MNPHTKNIRTQGKYSQNNEDLLIEKYFAGRAGTLLDVGANDGKSLSNTLFAIERGWNGVLIEPSKTAYQKLAALHESNKGVYCYNVALGETSGTQPFYESGEHLGNGDTSLISTIVASETHRWKGSKYDNFTTTQTDVITWEELYPKLFYRTFNLVSIDCEGMDLEVLRQMDLTAMGTEMLIVEWNSKDYDDYLYQATLHGLHEYSRNMENLVFVK